MDATGPIPVSAALLVGKECMSDDILIRVKAIVDDYEGTYNGMEHEQVTIDQLFKEKAHTLSSQGYLAITSKDGKIDKYSAKILRSKGWVHLETAKNREEKKVMKQEYFLLDESGKNSYHYYPKWSKINDINNLTEYELDQVAKGGRIVQVVSPSSVLSSSDYKKVQTRIKQAEEKKSKTKAALAKKQEQIKAKQIADAKKLLAEHNEMIAS